MKTRKYFKIRTRVNNPDVIVSKKADNGRIVWIDDEAKGWFYRVKPTTQREVLFIAGLEQYRDKFAPRISLESDRGEGVLISEAAMRMIDT